MLKLLDFMNLQEPLREFAREKPVFGTCAGAILMAKEVAEPGAGEPRRAGSHSRRRNGYPGRQID